MKSAITTWQQFCLHFGSQEFKCMYRTVFRFISKHCQHTQVVVFLQEISVNGAGTAERIVFSTGYTSTYWFLESSRELRSSFPVYFKISRRKVASKLWYIWFSKIVECVFRSYMLSRWAAPSPTLQTARCGRKTRSGIWALNRRSIY